MNDLTVTEQANVRAALRFLRTRCGTWATLGKALGFSESTIGNVAGGHKAASPLVAFRVAKLARVGVDDVLAGRYPEPGVCSHCGSQVAQATSQAAE